MTPDSEHWYSRVKAPLMVDTPSTHVWDKTSDVIIVGFGGAGAACALQSLEDGLSVIAVDAYDGGGATAASGGVLYAGGGTATQKAAGIEDNPQNMFNYLKLETGDIVSERTLKDFCERSAKTVDWLTLHGCDFRATLWPHKTSYPAPEYFLYYSDNTLIERYREHAKPAARGHRGYVPIEMGRKATGLGGSIFNPMKDAALKLGLELHPYTEVERLITDASGAVIGVRALSFPDMASQAAFTELRNKGVNLMAKWPPIMPGSGYFLKKAKRYLKKAKTIAENRVGIDIRAQKGVVLSAGGFVFNTKMIAHYAPKYMKGYPLGTEGDNGSGIRLGQSVGGRIGNMDRVTAWRFINPPVSFTKGIVVNTDGARFMDERVYGATLGVEIAENQNGESWLILDKAMINAALDEVKGNKALSFQRDLARLNIWFGAKKAKSITALARKINIDPDTLSGTLADYNNIAGTSKSGPYGKPGAESGALITAPFYAMNIGLGAKLFPCPTLTLGGLAVDETTGEVLSDTGKPIHGLYAAGRNAIGVASWNYVSGLSIADGIYAGRRAARHLGANGA